MSSATRAAGIGRFVSNVLVRPGSSPDTVAVRAAFTIWRIRKETNDVYLGSYHHELSYSAGQLRFRSRKAVLDLDALRPAGKVSIIL